MNPVTRFLKMIRGKAVDQYPDITGGTGIFSNLDWGDSWGDSKRMRAFKTSVYVYACVWKIAQKVGSIDLQLFKINNSKGDKTELFDHPALDLMYHPNPFQTKGQFFEKYMINKKLAGCAFVLKVRNNSGKVVELWNLRPDFMRILLDAEQIIKGFEFNAEGKVIVFKPEDIIYDNYPDPLSNLGGMSPLQPAQVRVDVEAKATEYQRYFFNNNARPDFLLLSEKKINADQKDEMRASWEKRHKGGKNAGKGAFLEGGLQYQAISMSQREMDYIESLKMTRDDILTAFGVPKPIVSITDDVNLANAKTAMEIFQSETIVPEIKQIVEKFNESMVYDDFDVRIYLDFVSPIKEDIVTKVDVQTKRIASGTLLINEARDQWGDAPLKGGNTLYISFGMQPIGGMPAEEGKAKTVAVVGSEVGSPYSEQKGSDMSIFKGRSKAMKRVKLVERIEKMILNEALKMVGAGTKNKDSKVVTKLIKSEVRDVYVDSVVKQIEKRGKNMEAPLNNFSEEQKGRLLKVLDFSKGLKADGSLDPILEEWAKKESGLAAEFVIPYMAEFLKEAGEQAMGMVAPAESFDAQTKRIVAFLKSRSKQFGRETTSTTYDKLTKTLAEGIAADEGTAKLVDRIDGVYKDYPLYRSEMIARTEATAANNKGFTEAYQQSGVANGKEWISTSDDRTRDSHIQVDGDVVGLDDSFSNGLQYPGDAKGGPEETINCRCVIGPAFIE